ncbi:uncharacterized protein LACBIDRAFT_298127 [Laccaria bicolor S238N-H82]|uniref:Predicted protein n=1 Tax=Laccaria bicolor (strain S238N-H82 / ATCC MYA-4686) TaxID=486041 RepID=B0DCB1_LACBS|nr:uncharacterized protein LACBIDRAFT_298127 [Laccaria bicolor S238N-H82]EDR07867.1 predicted protein [Laccaria bicolor S238N-H82]|eukprot:XP_001881656.1 predicted protein [Laccaria bicolor S238N-H82]
MAHPPPRCHPSTRERILQKIRHWITGDSNTRILWLSVSGSMGNGSPDQRIFLPAKSSRTPVSVFIPNSNP